MTDLYDGILCRIRNIMKKFHHMTMKKKMIGGYKAVYNMIQNKI